MDLGLDKLQTVVDRFLKLPKAYRIAAVPLTVGLIIAAYAYLLFIPAKQELDHLRAEQLKLQRKLNEVRSVAGNLPKFEEELENLQEQLKLALRKLPSSKELPVLLTDISTLGKDAGLEFKAFRPKAEVVRDFYAEVPIDIEFTGTFHDIAVFFDRIAKLPRIVNVDKLKLEIQKSTGQVTVLKAKGRATTFRFVENSEQGKKKRKASLAPGSTGKVKGGAA